MTTKTKETKRKVASWKHQNTITEHRRFNTNWIPIRSVNKRARMKSFQPTKVTLSHDIYHIWTVIGDNSFAKNKKRSTGTLLTNQTGNQYSSTKKDSINPHQKHRRGFKTQKVVSKRTLKNNPVIHLNLRVKWTPPSSPCTSPMKKEMVDTSRCAILRWNYTSVYSFATVWKESQAIYRNLVCWKRAMEITVTEDKGSLMGARPKPDANEALNFSWQWWKYISLRGVDQHQYKEWKVTFLVLTKNISRRSRVLSSTIKVRCHFIYISWK